MKIMSIRIENSSKISEDSSKICHESSKIHQKFVKIHQKFIKNQQITGHWLIKSWSIINMNFDPSKIRQINQ